MRFTQIRPLTEEDLVRLDELRMNPKSLHRFAASDAAQGIMAGFEAEMVFAGLGGSGEDDEYEPDYDQDERAYSIDDVVGFFEYDEHGYGLSSRGANRLREGLDEMYYEWHDEQMYDAFRDEAEDLIRKVIEDEEWDWEDATREALDGMGLTDEEVDEAMAAGGAAPRFSKSSDQIEYIKQHKAYENYLEGYNQAEAMLQAQAENSLSDQDGFYDSALDDFRDNFTIDDDSSFFNDVGLRYMSDVAEHFNLDWPYYTGGDGSPDGGFDEGNAENLADSLAKTLGVKTKVSSGYHSARRDAVTWIFEPDSSLDADDPEDMPVEIVSPPMPLQDCLKQLENFFTWAEENGGYTNRSTGFHMGVSLPHRGGNVDYVKLALFLGDEHVLNEFGRAGNHFCEAAMKKIRTRISRGQADVVGAMDLMRHNLLELAQRSIAHNDGFGKYTSINPQNGKYIEFRSAGGSDYSEDIDKLKNTLLRYAQAMAIAGDPAAERREYYKKLYKLISPQGDSGLDLFAKFTAGEISSRELKQQWAEKALAKDAPELNAKGDWVVIDQGTGRPVTGQEYNGFTRAEARARAKQKLSPGSSDTDFDMGYDIMPMYTGKWEVYRFDPNTDEESTLEIVDADSRGQAVDQVYDKYNQQEIPFKVRPWYQDAQPQAKPELTRRAELAKRIKDTPPEQEQMWQIINRRTGEVYDTAVRGTKSGLGKHLRGFEKEHGIPQGDAVLRLSPQQQQYTPHGVPEWELYDISTNNVINSMVAHNLDDAWQQADDWLRSIGAEDRSTYKQRFAIRPMAMSGVRDIPITVDQDQPTNVADYVGRWEIRSPTGGLIRHVEGNYNDAETARQQVMFRYENPADVTATPSPLQSAPQNNAPRADFEIYDSSNNNVVNTMRDTTADRVREVIRSYETPSGGYAPGVLRVRQV